MTPPTARLPAKLHRRVCLVLTEDAVLAEELLARKKLAGEVAGRLSDRACSSAPAGSTRCWTNSARWATPPPSSAARSPPPYNTRMPPTADPWTDRARDALSRYAEPLLRDVAAKLVRPRTPIPADELAERCVATLTNPPVIDRRIKEQPDAARKLLALVGLSRRPTWKVGHLVTLLAVAGPRRGVGPGPSRSCKPGCSTPNCRPTDGGRPRSRAWLGSGGVLQATVFAHPAVAGRARGEDLGLPDLPAEPLAATPRIADGLDWPLRLAAAWQQVDQSPVRLTQANTLFKRDLTRLQTDEVLSAPAADQLVELPDAGVLALFWARAVGLLAEEDSELRAAPFPPSWGNALGPTLTDLWAGLSAVEVWDPLRGYAPADTDTSPVPTAGLLALLLLAKVGPGGWADPQSVADWLWEHHPSWAGTLPKGEDRTRGRGWVEAFLLGVAYPLGLVEAAQHDGWKVRLTALGRHLLAGGPEPPPTPAFPQTLLVQPNAEVLAYRQGLTPALIGKLSRFAEWKGLGPACTLQLNPIAHLPRAGVRADPGRDDAGPQPARHEAGPAAGRRPAPPVGRQARADHRLRFRDPGRVPDARRPRSRRRPRCGQRPRHRPDRAGRRRPRPRLQAPAADRQPRLRGAADSGASRSMTTG